MRCYASCAFGIEGVLADEMRRLNLKNVAAQDARVYFDADEVDIARANIFLRTADRVYIVLAEFVAQTFEHLFEHIQALPLGDFLPSDARFPVNANAVQSTLMSVSDIQSISKKAAVRAMQRTYKKDPFPENGSTFSLYVNIHKDNATVALNTSGAGLNRRGYRLKNAQAPLRETLASAMILLSRWRTRDFFDPMCGSGTIAIEAAMIACGIAPGIGRRFDAQGYGNDFRRAFALAREEAESLVRPAEMQICASDIDAGNLALAKEHARNAGVERAISFERKDVRQFAQPTRPATIIANPPYAVRLGEEKETFALYRGMGKAFLPLHDTMVFILCATQQFEQHYGLRADKKRKLYNGNLQCTYYQYFKKRS